VVRRAHRPPLGRRVHRGLALGPAQVAPKGHSVLVVGPTQSGKTSGIVVPAIARWAGPIVVASAKSDVREATAAWRGALGPVVDLVPGRAGACTWDPLEMVKDHRGALEVARDLVVGDPHRASAESEFWNALAVKLLGALIWRAKRRGLNVFELVASVEDGRALSDDVGDDESARAVRSIAEHESRTADAVLTTVEAMLAPWSLPQPLARLEGLLGSRGTCYLVASRQHQRRHEGVLRGALGQLIAEQQFRHESGRAQPLLVVLDEAASVAPLEDLDQLASTGVGLSVSLLSVFQDFAQIEARWGERAATIVNNHATRVVLAGLADPRATSFVPELGADRATPPRRWPEGRALVVSGRAPARATVLVPWWRSRRLRRRLASRR
jgi:type IV secretion system protein VirD4